MLSPSQIDDHYHLLTRMIIHISVTDHMDTTALRRVKHS